MSTIAAISTAPGIGGIGIIRISGENSFNILNKIFKPKKDEKIEDIKGYTIKYGVIQENEKVIDEVLVSYFKAPKSYTAENMCEINSHGGIVVIKKILELCLKNGAEMAEPGEFTKRAFLNGRIDLAQAESVIDIINAKTEKEASASINQLEGFLSERINKIKNKMLSVMVDIEASIDYPEYDIEEVTNERAVSILKEIKEELISLEKSFDDGKILKEGIKTAIIGKPNAGKSSLLNAILKEERAIVTSIAGTTRDTIEEFISVKGIPLKIIDTAGIRDSSNEVEKIGIEKSKRIASSSDLLIAIFDISSKLNEEDEKILELVKDKKSIIILNKIDLVKEVEIPEKIKQCNKKIILISALRKQGIEEIYKEIVNMFELNEVNLESGTIITNERHKNFIRKAIDNVENSLKSIQEGLPIDIAQISMKEMLQNLGSITGDNVSEDIIHEIFSKFCLGK